jgi:hypothetical protein
MAEIISVVETLQQMEGYIRAPIGEEYQDCALLYDEGAKAKFNSNLLVPYPTITFGRCSI